MRYETEMMRQILTNPKAQEIIDYVSRIYGDSYVGLWLFQAIGTALGNVSDISDELRNETNPVTADLLLNFWEGEYGIPEDPSLTTEQRRLRIIAKMQNTGACTPQRLATAVSAALGGAQVEVTERTGVNQFTVNIRTVVDSIVPAVAVIERMKPAHLIYVLQVATQTVSQTEIDMAIALIQAEINRVEVQA